MLGQFQRESPPSPWMTTSAVSTFSPTFSPASFVTSNVSDHCAVSSFHSARVNVWR